MEKLKQAIKIKQFDNLYFFHGPERYLSEFYANKIKELMVEDEEFNFQKLYAEDISEFQEIVEACPVMEDKKLVLVKGRDFSEEWKEEQLSFLTEMLPEVPEYTCVIFLCTSINKKSKVYKLLAEKCTECVFGYQKPMDIINWIIKVVKTKGSEIDKDTAAFMLEYTGMDMTKILSEIDKIISYESKNGVISKEGIKEIITKTVETRVFDLMDAVTDGKKETAFAVLNDLKREKEEPVYINGAIMRNIKGILEYKLLAEEGKSPARIADKMQLKPYTQKKYAISAKKFSTAFLERILKRCGAFDIEVKSGEIDGYTGLNLIVAEMLAG